MVAMRAPVAAFRRWGLHVLMALPLALLAWRWAQLLMGGDSRALGLSAEPVNHTINYLGIWALRALWLTLAITPLRRIAQPVGLGGLGWLATWRRPLGLWCFAYASLHLAVYFGLDQLGSITSLFKDVVKHKFILLGMAAWCLLLPLALTSTRGMIRRLGARRWQRLHRLVYGAGVLVAIHYILRVKGFQITPWIYAALLAALLLSRVVPAVRQRMSRRGGIRSLA